jgi:DtxR family transcriptional regulator, Mn-dependent transcriptional regulator
LTALAGAETQTVLVRRIGEPVQVDHDALSLLTVARLLPGERVRVHRADGRVVALREGDPESTAVSLPDDVAQHVFGALV